MTTSGENHQKDNSLTNKLDQHNKSTPKLISGPKFKLFIKKIQKTVKVS